jgi:nicotinic acid mononucleotide adenylyltransferase
MKKIIVIGKKQMVYSFITAETLEDERGLFKEVEISDEDYNIIFDSRKDIHKWYDAQEILQRSDLSHVHV